MTTPAPWGIPFLSLAFPLALPLLASSCLFLACLSLSCHTFTFQATHPYKIHAHPYYLPLPQNCSFSLSLWVHGSNKVKINQIARGLPFNFPSFSTSHLLLFLLLLLLRLRRRLRLPLPLRLRLALPLPLPLPLLPTTNQPIKGNKTDQISQLQLLCLEFKNRTSSLIHIKIPTNQPTYQPTYLLTYLSSYLHNHQSSKYQSRTAIHSPHRISRISRISKETVASFKIHFDTKGCDSEQRHSSNKLFKSKCAFIHATECFEASSWIPTKRSKKKKIISKIKTKGNIAI